MVDTFAALKLLFERIFWNQILITEPKPKAIVWSFLAGVLFYLSCGKDRAVITRTTGPVPTPPSVSPSTYVPRADSSLIGKEFIFSSTWFFWKDAMGDMIYVSFDPHDSFSVVHYLTSQAEFLCKWIPLLPDVPFWNWYNTHDPFPSPTGYGWYFAHWPYYENSNFLIENFPFNYQLIGTTVKIKVKFV